MENDVIIQLMHWIYEDPNPPKGYTWKLDTLQYKGHIVILEGFHSSPIVGHSRFHKTYEITKHLLFWETTKNDIQYFVATCDTF
jgi:hypothetical protein